MPRCSWVRRRLTAFLLGELPGWQTRRVAAHVGRCPTCLQELDALRQVVVALSPAGKTAELPRPTAAETAHARELVRARRSRPARVAWALSAACLVALGALALRFRGAPLPAVGRVTRLSGHPEYRLPHRGWAPLPVQAVLPAETAVRTGETDLIEVEFTDGSRASLDFGTEVRVGARGDLPRRRSDPPRPDLHLTRGRVWLLVAKEQTGLQVHTEAGVAEALGTMFEVDAPTAKGPHPEAAVTVLKGSVRVSNEHGIVTAGEGMTTVARADQAPGAPRRVASVQSVGRQFPWKGMTHFEAWVLAPLDRNEAAHRVAGPRGWIGIELATASVSLTGEPVPGPGLTVKQVAPGSPAAQAGVARGDRLVRIGDIALQVPSDVYRAEVLFLPGERVALEFRRGASMTKVEIACQAPPEETQPREARLEAANRALAQRNTDEAGRQYLGLAGAGMAAGRHNLGVLAELAGRTEEAAGAYQEAIARDGREPRLHFSLAVALARLGNLRGAASELEATLTRAPHFPQARLMLGQVACLIGDEATAQEQARQLQSDPGTRADGLYLAGDLLRLRGDFGRSIRWYQRAAQADPLSPDPAAGLAADYYNTHDLRSARTWAERSLALDPGSARALNRLGMIENDEGHPERAEVVLLRAAARQPDNGIVYLNLGRAYYKLKDFDRAKTAYQRGIALAPDLPYPHVGLAMTFEKTHEVTRAADEYQVAMHLDPTYRDATTQLAALYRRLGDMASVRKIEAVVRLYGA